MKLVIDNEYFCTSLDENVTLKKDEGGEKVVVEDQYGQTWEVQRTSLRWTADNILKNEG